MRINSMMANYTNNIAKRPLNQDNAKINKENGIANDDNISIMNVRSPYPSGLITMDKGTAKGTTINVDRSTIFNIINYAVNDVENSGFEELGMDDNKRWVVINGQRFECELSPEEKELIRKGKAGCNLLSYINESDAEKYKNNLEKEKKKETIELQFNNGKAELSYDNNNPKIHNLLNNDKVMEMLSAIANCKPLKLQI